MFTDPQRDFLETSVRTMQIVVAALVMGVVSFFGVVLAMSFGGQPVPPTGMPLISYVGVALAVGAVVMSAVVPNLIAGQMRQSIVRGNGTSLSPLSPSDGADLGDLVPLVGAYQTRLIIGAALLEGAAFLNLVANMVEHRPLSLIVTGVLLLILLTKLPTASRLSEWVENELATVEQLRLVE